MTQTAAALTSLMRRAWHAAWHRRCVARSLFASGMALLGVAVGLALFQNEKRREENVSTRAFVTIYGGPPGLRIGWWNVTYPATLREGDEGTLEIKYDGDVDAWNSLSIMPTKLTITLRPPAGLEIRPMDQLSEDFAESVVSNPWFVAQDDWTIVPLRRGRHPVILTVSTEPSQFITNSISIGKDHTIISGSNVYQLPINVVTKYYIDQAWVDLGKTACGGLAFLLALPWMKLVVERLLPRRPA